mmetsp:Transcript_148067/g.283744  ORF Transcript_148067/g.283744 Transcript_148067/m.283744 type:complete len:187 (+) Transcript_148067:2-562(+)
MHQRQWMRCGVRPGRATLTAMADPFYQTSNAEYGRRQRRSVSAGAVSRDEPLSIAAMLARRPAIRRPMTAEVDASRFAKLQQRQDERSRGQAESVLYSPVAPRKFKPKECGLAYPPFGRRGADNPLFRTSAMSYGEEPPANHQINEFWFPLGHEFTQGFTDSAPRDTGIVTEVPRSKVHDALDRMF